MVDSPVSEEERRKSSETDLGQSEPFLREGALRVGDVSACHVTAIGHEDDTSTGRCEEEGGETGRDLRAEQLFGRLVDVADFDQRVVGVDEGSKLR